MQRADGAMGSANITSDLEKSMASKNHLVEPGLPDDGLQRR
jgi:hypothetical protein